MIEYLIKRPVGVFMSFLGLFIIGVWSYSNIPTTLLPVIDLPVLTVEVENSHMNARTLEENIIKPLKYELLQLQHIQEINTKTYDGVSYLELRFTFGTTMQYAFLETNEKIDTYMSALPKDMKRPVVFKQTTNDLPLIKLNVLAANRAVSIFELSVLAQKVLKKRIEQLPAIAYADILGLSEPKIYVTPDKNKLTSLGISLSDIENQIREVASGAFHVFLEDGQYQYLVNISSGLESAEQLSNLVIRANKHNYRLAELAEIKAKESKIEGLFFVNTHRGIQFSLIKAQGQNIHETQRQIKQLINDLKRDYPQLIIEATQDQSQIIAQSIGGLKQTLFLGILLAMFIVFLFQKNLFYSLNIFISVPISLFVSFIPISFFSVSLNIISISGIILAMGLLIDNTIIILDSIKSKISTTASLAQAVSQGVYEVMRSLIGSTLTTLSIFVPFAIWGGLSGVLFADQILVISIVLITSLVATLTFSPVLFFRLYRKLNIQSEPTKNKVISDFRFKPKLLYTYITLVFIAFVLIFPSLQKEFIPKIESSEKNVTIKWHTQISPIENKNRMLKLIEILDEEGVKFVCKIGKLHFLYQTNQQQQINTTELFFETFNPQIKSIIEEFVSDYKTAQVNFSAPESIYSVFFNAIHTNDEWKYLFSKTKNRIYYSDIESFPLEAKNSLPVKEYIRVRLNTTLLKTYNIPFENVYYVLRKLLTDESIYTFKNSTPVEQVVLQIQKDEFGLLKGIQIENENHQKFPIEVFLEQEKYSDLFVIYSNSEQEFLKLPENIGQPVEDFVFKEKSDINLIIKDISRALVFSFFLLFILLTIQFESIKEALVVLIEIPLDIAAVLFLLWLSPFTLNLFSITGIFMFVGIVINDSILKIDTIKALIGKKMPLKRAIAMGGKMRLKAILSTSLTTIFALLPTFIFSSYGNELQEPFAFTMIMGLVVGTVNSIFILPQLLFLLNPNYS